MASQTPTSIGSRAENPGRPPWPDQFTEAQYDRQDVPVPHRDTPIGSDLLEAISTTTRTVASNIAAFAQRRPLSALAGAFIAGIFFTLLSRRRRS
jgi:hypothetical protein